MKRVLVICLLLLFPAFALTAQEELILQRVHVAPVEVPRVSGGPEALRGCGYDPFCPDQQGPSR